MLSSKRPSCLIKSHAANGSSDTCSPSSSSISEKPEILKQFLTVFGVTSVHANTCIFMAYGIEIFWSGFLLSIASIIFWTTSVLYFAFKERITPWSIGCKADVVLGGRKNKSIAFNPSIFGCAVRVSMISVAFPFSLAN